MNKLDFKNIPFFPPVFHITPDSDIDHLHQKQQYNKVYQKDRFYPFSKVNCDSCTHYYHHNAKDIPAIFPVDFSHLIADPDYISGITYICIQVKENSLEHFSAEDGVIG